MVQESEPGWEMLDSGEGAVSGHLNFSHSNNLYFECSGGRGRGRRFRRSRSSWRSSWWRSRRSWGRGRGCKRGDTIIWEMCAPVPYFGITHTPETYFIRIYTPVHSSGMIFTLVPSFGKTCTLVPSFGNIFTPAP